MTLQKSNQTTEEQNNLNKNKETKETESSSDENKDDENDNQTLDNSTRNSNNEIKLSSSLLTVKLNQLRTFKDLNNIEYNGKVLSRAGKATGKYKLCHKIEYQSPSTLGGTKTWIDKLCS